MHRVLLVDDDPIQVSLVSRFLEGPRFEVVSTSSAEDAIRLLDAQNISIFITDLEMPRVSGGQLIEKAQALANPPVIIVITAHGETDRVIETFKAGIFDYLVKPVRREDLVRKVEAAGEKFQLRTLGNQLEENRVKKLEDQISWNVWKENVLNRHQSGLDRRLFGNLYQALAQGAGFGAMISLCNMIVTSARKNDQGQYVVDAELVEMLFESEQIAHRLMEKLGEMHYLQSGDLETERIPLAQLLDKLDSVQAEMDELRKKGGHKIVVGRLKSGVEGAHLKVNLKYTADVFRELILNAMKFSEKRTSIYVLSNLSSNSVQFSFLNTPLQSTEIVGIPPEYEQLVLEPFYRMVPQVMEEYESLDHGLGLATVAAVVRNQAGEIRISSVRDYLTETDRKLVNVMISLPLVE